ncbi:unnamed protein product [Blepharisma stoltei]|uniref:Cyclic nucleotide-binding domain-containing protein n=1 Tax=Blepharisma stoltei TaxID=1481888 RepID=A0AAU9IXU7_9CILI|nr:unnamed protein product [Blepharisma stoltei]
MLVRQNTNRSFNFTPKEQPKPILNVPYLMITNAPGSPDALSYIVSILNSPPPSRTLNTLKTLMFVTKDIPFFTKIKQEYNEDAHKNCCQYMCYFFSKKGEFVINAGEYGDTFYIILQGVVKVLVPTSSPGQPDTLIEVATLEAGSAFGELALLKNQPRAASIICTEDCHFATLSKEPYLRILGKLTAQKLDELVSFLSKLPVFSSWTAKSLVNLSYYFTQVKFTRNQVIYSEGDPPACAYIIREGEVQLTRSYKIQIPSNNKSLCTLKNRIKKHQKIKVAILTKGEMFGDAELLSNNPRSYTCTCSSSEVDLLTISKLEFKRRIIKEESIFYIMKKNKIKEECRETTYGGVAGINIQKSKVIEPLKDIETHKDSSIINDLKTLSPSYFQKIHHDSPKLLKVPTFDKISKSQLSPKLMRSIPSSPRKSRRSLTERDSLGITPRAIRNTPKLNLELLETSTKGTKSSGLPSIRHAPISPRELKYYMNFRSDSPIYYPMTSRQ